jgi:hypothetical protein
VIRVGVHTVEVDDRFAETTLLRKPPTSGMSVEFVALCIIRAWLGSRHPARAR